MKPTATLLSAALIAAFTLLAPAAETQKRPTRFWNLTKHTIFELRLAPAGTSNWGADQCRNDKDGSVDPDERLRITGITSGQYDATQSLGFTYVGSMRYVILPQVMRKMLAPLLNQFIVLIKESALVAYIGALDVMHRGDMVATEYARPLEAYTVVAGTYFVMCFLASRSAHYVGARFSFPE